ncbi:MAG: hypothetical protein IKJ74_01005 [Clostridia bacterium]|nr:hypothetical protein [Clostridia bacterium]
MNQINEGLFAPAESPFFFSQTSQNRPYWHTFDPILTPTACQKPPPIFVQGIQKAL